jgi:flagellar hook-length control protein FliK
MTTTLSSATAAAKAAQAELTAPVAANNTVTASGKSTATAGKQAANTESSAGQAAAKPAPATTASQPAAPGASRQPAQAASQPDSRSADVAHSAAQAAAQAAADAAPVAAPLFSQLLNLADVAADSSSDSTVAADSDDSTGSGSAAAGNVLPAMITSLLNAAAPAPAPAVAAAGSQADSGSSVDAISATATLNSSATRLNLAAASVAVAPAAADDTSAVAAAQASAVSATATAPQGVYAQTNNATLAAVAARQSESSAAAPASSDSAAPAVDTDAALPLAANTAPLREAWVNGARVVTRAADTSTTPAANSAAPAAAPVASSAGDERSFTLATPGINASHASAAGQSAAPAAASTGSTVVLNGTPEQWQQPLREALGDRLQVQLQRNNDQAVIRLEPPNMGSIEISIRHSAGSLQVNLSASNSEVLRQLNTIGDSVRQDLSNRQFSDVAVTVSSSRAQAQADQGGRNGQQRSQDDGRTPGRALNEDDSTATFAMTGE